MFIFACMDQNEFRESLLEDICTLDRSRAKYVFPEYEHYYNNARKLTGERTNIFNGESYDINDVVELYHTSITALGYIIRQCNIILHYKKTSPLWKTKDVKDYKI
jgi:hypothetical protein